MEEIIEFETARGLTEDSPAREIRQEVFVEEQGFCREFDEIDETALHVVLLLGGVPAATGRTFPKAEDPGVYVLGRVAVKKSLRGHSLGGAVVQKLEELALEAGAHTAELSAQLRARGFYEKLGYTAQGPVYKDEYCPHIAMQKKLAGGL